MKHLEEHNEFLRESKASELNKKLKEIKIKYRETREKIKETKKKVRDEVDRTKQELNVITLQKLAAKLEMLDLDVQILKIKRTQL